MLKRGFAKIKDEQGRADIAGAKKLVKAHLLPINHPYVGMYMKFITLTEKFSHYGRPVHMFTVIARASSSSLSFFKDIIIISLS